MHHRHIFAPRWIFGRRAANGFVLEDGGASAAMIITGDLSLKDLVFTALEFAQECGYVDHVYHEAPQTLAFHMMTFDPDISQIDTDILHIVPLIEAWRRRQMN